MIASTGAGADGCNTFVPVRRRGNSFSLRQLPREGANYHKIHVVREFSVAAGKPRSASRCSLRRPQRGSAPRSEHLRRMSSYVWPQGVRYAGNCCGGGATPSALAATASAAGSTRPTRPPRGSQLPQNPCSKSVFCGRGEAPLRTYNTIQFYPRYRSGARYRGLLHFTARRPAVCPADA